MSTLNNVVDAMSKESNNSTLGWDVVVNYTASEMNQLLADEYKGGGEHQLMEIPVKLKISNSDGELVTIDYVFKLGAPLIQFDNSAIVPACGLTIPVIGGSVKNPTPKTWTIEAGVYSLVLSGIALASVEGKQGPRVPKPSNESFVFSSPNTTGAVTLDLNTSASKGWLNVALNRSRDHIPLIDTNIGNLEKEIKKFFTTLKSVHWDLAQVNNRSSTGSTQLVPKFFRFATYSPGTGDSKYTILSVFIHVDGLPHGGTEDQLQSRWTTQWANYKVPPIPESFTASVIFNYALIKDAAKKSIEGVGMKIEEIPKVIGDKSSIKWKILTGKKYELKDVHATGSHWPYSEAKIWGVNLDLDTQAEGLFLSIGQNNGTDANANALLKWQFSFTTSWMWVHGATGNPQSGEVTVTNKLDKFKYFDNEVLPNYRVHLDASCGKSDWSWNRTFTNEKWYDVLAATTWDASSKDSLPDPPSLVLNLFDIDFFMTTNLLLPNSNVIEFNSQPGVRFPRDLYLVGNIVHKSKVDERRAASAS